MSRGILYIVWGNYNKKELQNSMDFAKQFVPNLPMHVAEVEPRESYLNQIDMFELSPFDETLYLDTDACILDSDLEFGFEMAKRHNIAVANDPVNLSNRWGNRFKDCLEYNMGVVFFKKGSFIKELHAAMLQSAKETGHGVSQAALSDALHNKLKANPFNLLPNWNFFATMQPSPITGEIKIWHSHAPVLPGVYKWNAENQGLKKKTGVFQMPDRFTTIFDTPVAYPREKDK